MTSTTVDITIDPSQLEDPIMSKDSSLNPLDLDSMPTSPDPHSFLRRGSTHRSSVYSVCSVDFSKAEFHLEVSDSVNLHRDCALFNISSYSFRNNEKNY